MIIFINLEICWKLSWRSLSFKKTYFSKNLKAYSINLCKIDCRISRALHLCNCIPFFYTVANVKVCNISGMLCLTEKPWYNTTGCECPNLCETTIMTKVTTKEVNYGLKKLVKFNLMAKLSFSKTWILTKFWQSTWFFLKLVSKGQFCSIWTTW